MLIRYGYEITLTCQQPTAQVCLLSIHEDRAADIRVPETLFTIPDVPTTIYRDLFGNRCRRLVAPAGDLTIWGDATIEDDGQPDRAVPGARKPAVRAGIAGRLPRLSHGQPLLRDRPAQLDCVTAPRVELRRGRVFAEYTDRPGSLNRAKKLAKKQRSQREFRGDLATW